MKSKPEVSVIIATHNRAGILAKHSLPSVLNQSHKSLECIVVDDCSSDGTGEVVKKFQQKDSRVKYMRLPRNAGVSAARNAGVQHAGGEYISFLDDDDELLPDFLEATLLVLKDLPPQFGGVVADRIYVLNSGDKIYLSMDLSGSFYHAMSVGWLLRKGVFSEISYDEGLWSDEDADFGIRFFSTFKAKEVHRPLLLVHDHGAKESGLSLPSDKRLIGLDQFLKKNLHVFKSRGGKKDLEFIYRFAGRNYCWGGQMRKGIPLLGRAFLTKPDPRNALNFLAAALGHEVYLHYWGAERKLIRLLRARFINPARDLEA